MWQRRVGCLRARYGDHSAERCRGRQGSLGLLSPVAPPPDLPVRPADGWKRPVGGQHLQYGRHPLRASGTGNGFAQAVHDRLARQGLSGADPCPGRLVQHVSPGVTTPPAPPVLTSGVPRGQCGHPRRGVLQHQGQHRPTPRGDSRVLVLPPPVQRPHYRRAQRGRNWQPLRSLRSLRSLILTTLRTAPVVMLIRTLACR